MQLQDVKQSALRLRAAIAAEHFLRAARRLEIALKDNPYWHLQPRIPRGEPAGGQWVAYLVGAGGSILPVLQRVGAAALQRLRSEARKLAPILRRLPRRWDDDSQPSEESYDAETRRISRSSWQRRGEPNIRFRTERELRRHLGPADQVANGTISWRSGWPDAMVFLRN